MRSGLLIALALLGCGGKSKPATPPVDPARADAEAFCSPEAAAKTSSMQELGPYLEPRMHDGGEMKKLLLELKEGRISIPELQPRMQKLIEASHVTPCPTFDKLFSPKTE